MTEVEAYEKHKNLKLAAAEIGMPWQTLYVRLRQAGISVTGDKMRHGSEQDRFAAGAEREFQRLVPSAQCANEARWQAKVDFDVGGLKVDIKASNVTAQNRWTFCVKKQSFCADFLVCFAYDGERYRLLLIPGEVVRNYQTISVCRSFESKWAEYEVQPGDLEAFFAEAISFI